MRAIIIMYLRNIYQRHLDTYARKYKPEACYDFLIFAKFQMVMTYDDLFKCYDAFNNRRFYFHPKHYIMRSDNQPMIHVNGYNDFVAKINPNMTDEIMNIKDVKKITIFTNPNIKCATNEKNKSVWYVNVAKGIVFLTVACFVHIN